MRPPGLPAVNEDEAIGIGTRARMVACRSIGIGTPSGKTNMGGISWHS
jgi:hypothetical protein